MARDIWDVAGQHGMMSSGGAVKVLSVSAGKRLKAGGQNAHDRPRLSATGYHCIQYYSANLETLYKYLRVNNPVIDCKNDSDSLLIVLGHGRHEKYGLYSDQKKKMSKSTIAKNVLDAAGVAVDVMEAAGPIGLGVFLVVYPASFLIQKGVDRKKKYKWWVRVSLCSKIESFCWDDSVAVFKSRTYNGKEAHLREMTEALSIDQVKHHPAMTAANVTDSGLEEEFEVYQSDNL